MDMVDILLGLIRASREGDWMLHLASVRAMIPWCFAYDRLNYARYLPYYAHMSQLPTTHPDVHAEFMQGGFSVQLGSNNPFGRIPVDQTIEETVNKDTQTPRGTKGFSLKPGAVSRHYLTAEYRAVYLRTLRGMIGQGRSKLSHPDLQGPRIRKNEADVKSLIDMMENSWLNPLSPDEADLVSLSTDTMAPPAVAKDLLRALEVGEEAYQTFKQTRLDDDPPSVKFHDKLTKQRLKTFSTIGTKTAPTKGQNVVLKADRNLFSQMILVAESRSVNMKDVIAHPLGPLPWALAHSDGSLRKTNKAALARELEKNVYPAEAIPTPSTCIIDGMGLVQMMNGNNKTFAQLAESVLAMVLLWSSFNKTSRIKFLVGEWRGQRYRDMLQGKALHVTCEETCLKMTVDEWVEVTELQSTQEEADTRLLLHALNAARTGSKQSSSQPKTLMSCCFVWPSKRIFPVPSVKSVGHRTAHDLSTSANWPCH